MRGFWLSALMFIAASCGTDPAPKPLTCAEAGCPTVALCHQAMPGSAAECTCDGEACVFEPIDAGVDGAR